MSDLKALSTPVRPIRVVFLIFYFEAWDSLSQVYQSMLRDPRFEPIVASIPRKLTGDIGYGGEKRVHKFFKRQGIEHVRLTDPDSWASLAQLKALAPDYVFLNYPWQRNYQPAFRPDSLATFTRILYTPYFLAPLVNEQFDTPASGKDAANSDPTEVAAHLYTQRVHQLASLVFVQDADTQLAFGNTERGSKRVWFTGSPKLDSLRKTYVEALNKLAAKSQARASREVKTPRRYDLKVLWAPHHSYSPAWLNFGMFVQSYQQMLDVAKRHPRVQFVLRPHPFLFGTLIDRGVISAEILAHWQEAWKALPNTKTNAKASFAKQFASTNMLLTDGISFLAEYPLITGKPAIFLENPDHWQINHLGAIAAAANQKIGTVAEFEALLVAHLAQQAQLNAVVTEPAAQGAVDVNKLQALREAIDPNPGTAANIILNAIVEDFTSDAGLVDPSKLAEIAWEDQPGREPRTD